MRILQICNKSPYPPAEGGPIAMNNITQGLIRAGQQVKVLAMDTYKYPVQIENIPVSYLNETAFEYAWVDLSINPLLAFLNLFTNKSYHVQRFISGHFDDKLTQILQGNIFDVILLETIYTAPYIPTIRALSDARIVIRTHNIEYLIWQRMAEKTANLLKRLYLQHLARTLKKFELSVIDQCDGIAAITSHDAGFFKTQSCKAAVIDIPFGVDPDTYQYHHKPGNEPDLFHIGTMNWIPNEEGIRWFLENIWPIVREKNPGLKFFLAGRMMPEWLQKMNDEKLVVVGEVEDARQFMNAHDLMVVPLLSGSGIRIKIIEAMAMGKVVVTTSIGAEGISCTDGTHLLIADTPEEFASAVQKCIEYPALCRAIGRNARKFIEDEYNNHGIIEKLLTFFRQISDK